MRNIYFLLFAKNTNSKVFSRDGTNPGIGGTQFNIISLCLRLSLEVPHWNFFLVNGSPVIIEDAPSNFKQIFYDNPSDFLGKFVKSNQSVIISTSITLKEVAVELLQPISDCLIIWSHHPFDKILREIAKSIAIKAIVCVGVYQYYSNNCINTHLSHIQNVFTLEDSEDNKILGPLITKDKINIVYLGALIPAKGFLDVAKAWPTLKSKIPGIKLHVIGSSETYGEKPTSKLIPAHVEFSNSILEFVPEEDIQNGDVTFYGNLGEEKFDIIKKCDLAILNPTGRTEAFPASPLEIMSCGVPVIASDDYGMSDCMRFFPELIIHGHHDILSKVGYLVSNPLRYRELQHRSIAVAKWFSSQTDQIIVRWIRLLNSMLEKELLALSPVMPFYGSRLKLIYRRSLSPRLSPLKMLVKKLLRLVKFSLLD